MTTVKSTSTENMPVQIEALLKAIEDMPSIPETLFQILKIVDDPDSSAGDLAEVIRLDAPLTAKILRLANSPYYSGSGGIADIKTCVNIMGFRTVRQVAICVSIASSLMSECYETRSEVDYRELWRHSVQVAAIAKRLGQLREFSDTEEVFTAGLLHDLGKFVIVLNAPTCYEHLIALRRETGRPLVAVEKELLGYDHALAGEAFGLAWRFPPVLTATARKHHDHIYLPVDCSLEEDVVAIVRLADHLAHSLLPTGTDLGYAVEHLDLPSLYTAGRIPKAVVEADQPNIIAAVQAAGIYLDLS